MDRITASRPGLRLPALVVAALVLVAALAPLGGAGPAGASPAEQTVEQTGEPAARREHPREGSEARSGIDTRLDGGAAAHNAPVARVAGTDDDRRVVAWVLALGVAAAVLFAVARGRAVRAERSDVVAR